MFGFLLVVLLLVGLFMAVVVLLQAGKGGGLASVGGGAGPGTDTLIGGRQAATLLTKATWVSGGLFLFLALVLSILSSRQTSTPQSILRDQFQSAPATPRQIAPGTQELPGTQPPTTTTTDGTPPPQQP